VPQGPRLRQVLGVSKGWHAGLCYRAITVALYGRAGWGRSARPARPSAPPRPPPRRGAPGGRLPPASSV